MTNIGLFFKQAGDSLDRLANKPVPSVFGELKKIDDINKAERWALELENCLRVSKDISELQTNITEVIEEMRA